VVWFRGVKCACERGVRGSMAVVCVRGYEGHERTCICVKAVLEAGRRERMQIKAETERQTN
jgi:hypothetical protein